MSVIANRLSCGVRLVAVLSQRADVSGSYRFVGAHRGQQSAGTLGLIIGGAHVLF